MAEGEKTEAPTPKKREEAREKGNVAQSKDVPTLLVLAVAVAALASPLGGRVASFVLDLSRASLGGRLVRPDSAAEYQAVLVHAVAGAMLAMAPLVLLVAAVGVVSHLVQTGLLFTTYPLVPRWQKLSPAAGVKRMVSPERLFDLVKALLKLAVTLGLLWWILEPSIPLLMSLMDASPIESVRAAGELALKLVLAVLALFALFAAIDVVWVRFRHEEKLKMTKSEVRDEHKQREGDPKLKSKMRRTQQELSRQRMIASVSEADVVVTNPTHYAVALQYRPPAVRAPRVLAKGRNHVALRIRGEAEKHGVPIVENPPVAQLLYRNAALGAEIPESLYKAVAEVLAMVSRLDPRRAAAWRSAP